MTTARAPDRVEPTDDVAPARHTSRILTAGAVLGAFAFGVAIFADLAGVRPRVGHVGEVDVGEFLLGLLHLSPWDWALLGTIVVIATPAVGLVVTAFEYDAIADRRAALMALAVLAVLAISLLVALLT